MKKFWEKIRPKGTTRSQSSSTQRRPWFQFQPRSAIDDFRHAANTTLAPGASRTPLESQNPQYTSPSSPSSPFVPTPSGHLTAPTDNHQVALKSIVGGLSAFLRQYDRYIPNQDDLWRLIRRVERFATEPPGEGDVRDIARRRNLGSNLKTVLETLSLMSEQPTFSGSINHADQTAKIASLIEDIRDAIMGYQTSQQQDPNNNLFTFNEFSMFMRGCLGGSVDQLFPANSVLLDKLPRSKYAGYPSRDQDKCLRGTRVKVLETIENWIYQNGTSRVYWLNGLAGSGKTMIARSLAERMFAEGLLGASFFCSFDSPDRRDLHSIFPTLAFQLAYKYSTFRDYLVKTLESNPDSCHGSLSHQLEKLLVEPLQSTDLSTVIIIDALDECEDEEQTSEILSSLSQMIDRIPSIKFFITSRPESHIRSGFRLDALRLQTEILFLHRVEPKSVDEDIKLFLEYRLKDLVKNRSDIDFTMPWLTPGDVQVVTTKAGGLFKYASAIIDFVTSAGHLPHERLQMIISMPDSSVCEGRSGIDAFYTRVLKKSCVRMDHRESREYFSRLSLVVGPVALLREPISVTGLATLLGMGSKDILNSIRFLHSVLLIPDFDTQPIRFFHKSFTDYITDRERCEDDVFLDMPIHHARLTISCFKSMETQLKTNICNLPKYAMNDDIHDLATRRNEFIGEALVYACRFWSKHLCSMSYTGDNVAKILKLLRLFVERRLLQWLEVLSIVKDLRVAVHSLIDAERWLINVEPPDGGLLNSIRECQRFILYSFDPIEQSAAHIYDSALLWPPEKCLFRALYADQLRSQVKLLNGIDSFWNTCIRTIALGGSGRVESVFSPKGDLIAGCNGTVLKILEAVTGACLYTLHGHKEDVNSVAFSHDGMFLVSGSNDRTLKVWNAQTGSLVTTLEGHTDSIRSVAFSPTGSMVASGSDDCTVRIWDIPSASCGHILGSHSQNVLSICWLQTNQVVSGCAGGIVNVWDVLSGERLTNFDKHSDPILSVASSPDTSMIASGSRDGSIRVHDTKTGGVLQTIMADAMVTSVDFSPNGDKIVYATTVSIAIWDLVAGLAIFQWRQGSLSVSSSPDWSCFAAGSWDGFVRVFQPGMVRDQDIGICDRHSSEVRCVASSADGRMVATGSKDATVKVWDPNTGSCTRTFYIDHSSACSAAFSPDSSLIACGCNDKVVRIWSLLSNAMIATLKDHTDEVHAVRFFPDGKRLISVSAYQEILLWDAEEWKKLAHLPPQTRKESDSKVSVSTDGTCVILQSRQIVNRWNITPNMEYSSEATSPPSSESSANLPMDLVPTPDSNHDITYGDVRPYSHPLGSEWILDQDNRRVCWIPDDRRLSDLHGNKVFLGTMSGGLAIIHFLEIPTISPTFQQTISLAPVELTSDPEAPTVLDPLAVSAQHIAPHMNNFDPTSIEATQVLHRALALQENDTLQGDAQYVRTLIEALDVAIESPSTSPESTRECLRALTKICGKTGLLPSSYTLTERLSKSRDGPIAGGGFGDVWKGTYDGRPAAIKVLRIYQVDRPEALKKEFCKEVILWKRLSHPNIVPFYGVSTELSQFCMVSAWMSNEHIRKYVQAKPDVDRLQLLTDVAKGLNYLHSSKIVHGDLKGDNILINDVGMACLCDFGLTSVMRTLMASTSTTKRGRGSIRWMAPELIDTGDTDHEPAQQSRASDIYAISMVVIEVLTGEVPFHLHHEAAVMYKTVRGTRPHKPGNAREFGISDALWETVELCWKHQPADRPEISFVLASFRQASRY